MYTDNVLQHVTNAPVMLSVAVVNSVFESLTIIYTYLLLPALHYSNYIPTIMLKHSLPRPIL